MVSDHNKAIREKIAALEKLKKGMSFGHIDYPQISSEIQSLAAQLTHEAEEIPTKKIITTHIIQLIIAFLAGIGVFFFSQVYLEGLSQKPPDNMKPLPQESETTQVQKSH